MARKRPVVPVRLKLCPAYVSLPGASESAWFEMAKVHGSELPRAKAEALLRAFVASLTWETLIAVPPHRAIVGVRGRIADIEIKLANATIRVVVRIRGIPVKVPDRDRGEIVGSPEIDYDPDTVFGNLRVDPCGSTSRRLG